MQSASVLGKKGPRYDEIITEDAVHLLVRLHRAFETRRQELLSHRRSRQKEFDLGILPDFLPETAYIRSDPLWHGPLPAPGLVDRRVEITGPVDRKMVINALNSGATQYMADFEDSTSPTWCNLMEGQINLKDAVHREIEHETGDGKLYKLKENPAVLLVRYPIAKVFRLIG